MTIKKRFTRSKLFIIGGLLVILVAGIVVWNHYKYKFVNKKLDNLVNTKSRGLYQVNYEHLVIDEALGSLSAENIEMLPDSQVYQSMLDDKTAPEDLFFIRIPALLVTGVKTPKALLNKEISAHLIRIKNAEIEIRLGEKNKEGKTDFKKVLQGEIYRQLLGKLNSIQADSIVLENASLTLKDKDSKSIRCRLSGLSIRFAGTAIDSAEQEDSTRILFSREISIECHQLMIPMKNKIYDFRVEGLDYSSQRGSLHTDLIRLAPLLSETAFASSNKYAKDRFDISLRSLNIEHIDRQAMLREELVAGEMKLEQLSLRVFRDKSYPHDSVNRTEDYPHQAIMNLPLQLYIQKILINDSYIEYKEKNDKSDSSGKVSFFHVQATLENVTNMRERIRRSDRMLLQFNSRFLDQTSLNVQMNMRLNDRQGRFHLDARMDALTAGSLNPLLKPMALAELDKGKINQLVYHLDATNTYGNGTLDFLYEDLSVKLLKKDDDQNKYKTKTLPTLAAGIILKKSNPMHGKTRIGNVDYTRDVHRSIFNLMWKSLFSGIKQIAI